MTTFHFDHPRPRSLESAVHFSDRVRIASLLCVALAGFLMLPGCFSKPSRDRTKAISQQLAEQKTKTDNLRKAMQFLKQMTPQNRSQSSKEVQLALNTWLLDVDRSSIGYSSSALYNDLPTDMLDEVGCKSAVELQFSYWDVDYLYQRRMMSKLSSWIANFPLRDSLLVSALETRKSQLDPTEALKLEEACKLFDWVMRNVALEPGSSSVEELFDNPVGPIDDAGIGYGYLPWETLLFSSGDFVEKGRVFTALAHQRGIDTAWIEVKVNGDAPGKIWAIGVVSGDDLLVFEPKLAMPILDPDSGEFATLTDAQTNSRVLRRLDLPGQFDYALDAGDLGTGSASANSLRLLIDLPPVAVSARMKVLERSLLSDERMTTFHDLNALEARLKKCAPGTPIRLWQIPLQAQLQAASVRERLLNLSPYTMQYMGMHGVWMLDTPAAQGRFAHLYGNFENSLDETGALSFYMNSRVDEESIGKLAFDPKVQKELGVPRMPTEEMEQYQMRVMQMQQIFRRSKVDAAFLLAQLHFDRGNYEQSRKFYDRVLDTENQLAEPWWGVSRYCLARIYQEQGELEKASELLTFQPSEQEAGNRLRLRYLRRLLDPEQEAEPTN